MEYLQKPPNSPTDGSKLNFPFIWQRSKDQNNPLVDPETRRRLILIGIEQPAILYTLPIEGKLVIYAIIMRAFLFSLKFFTESSN
jgi:hypothetical protein